MKDNWLGIKAADAPVGAARPCADVSATSTAARGRAAAGLEDQLGSVPGPVRRKMVATARSASSADEALAPIIDLLVDGSPAKRAAIVSAFRNNAPLREQWERTYEILRTS